MNSILIFASNKPDSAKSNFTNDYILYSIPKISNQMIHLKFYRNQKKKEKKKAMEGMCSLNKRSSFFPCRVINF